MFAIGTFAIAVAIQELWRGTRARQAMTGDGPVSAFGSLMKRNRRRYGGYLVHIGMATLFIGVAASSAFNGERDVRMAAGQSVTVDGYTFTYVKPTGVIEQRAGELERISLGSRIRVTKDGRDVAILEPSRGYYPVNAGIEFGILRRYFEGESTSEIGLKAGLGNDLWIAQQPDIAALQQRVERADAVFVELIRSGRVPMTKAAEVRDLTLARFVRDYAADPPPAQFRVVVSPMVQWIWAGALIVFAGGLIALWPAPGAVRGRARARLSARVAQDLGRA
jgi:cytochrome c-type biogenesis protein CcmF